jgi:Adaptor complexes medium subunit family
MLLSTLSKSLAAASCSPCNCIAQLHNQRPSTSSSHHAACSLCQRQCQLAGPFTHTPPRACVCLMPGLVAQVLFETQGRSNRQKAVDLEDIKFHQCVRLARFESDRTISFVPPDGAFDLMSYRLSQNIK